MRLHPPVVLHVIGILMRRDPPNRRRMPHGLRRLLGRSIRIRTCIAGTTIVGLCCALGVPLVAQDAPALRLTLPQAIDLALKNNVAVLITDAERREAVAVSERRRSALLPHASADALVNRQNRNLAAVGLSIPNVPTVVGPYSYLDFRVSASQSI